MKQFTLNHQNKLKKTYQFLSPLLTIQLNFRKSSLHVNRFSICSPLEQFLASFHLTQVTKNVLDSVPDQYKPQTYYRYWDDMISYLKNFLFHEIVKENFQINSSHLSTYELEVKKNQLFPVW